MFKRTLGLCAPQAIVSNRYAAEGILLLPAHGLMMRVQLGTQLVGNFGPVSVIADSFAQKTGL